jgi:hypothetical protein
MSRLLAVIGISITLIYSALLGWLVKSKWKAFQALELNTLGDFCAGAFGPLAILWLVLGYFQQGIELRQNSKALDLQAKELANAVDQYKQLVEEARAQREFDIHVHERAEAQQVEFERRNRGQVQPKFKVRNKSINIADMEGPPRLVISNEGYMCSDVVLSVEGEPVKIEPNEWHKFDKDIEEAITLIFPRPLDHTPRTLTLRYLDQFGKPATISGELKVNVSELGRPLPAISFELRPKLE